MPQFPHPESEILAPPWEEGPYGSRARDVLRTVLVPSEGLGTALDFRSSPQTCSQLHGNQRAPLPPPPLLPPVPSPPGRRRCPLPGLQSTGPSAASESFKKPQNAPGPIPAGVKAQSIAGPWPPWSRPSPRPLASSPPAILCTHQALALAQATTSVGASFLGSPSPSSSSPLGLASDVTCPMRSSSSTQ